MAKVHTVAHGNPANRDWQVWAAVINDVRLDAKLTVDEFAGVIGRDARQVGKWLSATERPQIETVWAYEQFQEQIVLALGRRVKSITVVTQLMVQRPA